MQTLLALIGVILLAGVAALGAQVAVLGQIIAVAIPYAAFLTFLAGVSWRILQWTRVPVPFRIPTTCGQEQSLAWIKTARLESPSTTAGVVGRMALEVLLFRSLFRNTRADLRKGPRLVFGEAKWLWLGALTFHWSLLVIGIRHLRLFLEPVPAAVTLVASVDGFFQIGTPEVYATDAAVFVALAYLLARRLWDVRLRDISLVADYAPLFLLLGIAATGLWMRHVVRVDVVAVKQWAIGMATLAPVVPNGVSELFFAHLTLVSLLAAWFPFSKLMHMAGVFLSPTRNLANTSRARRHVNPWNTAVTVHPYEAWEAEFRDKIKAAGLPLEKG